MATAADMTTEKSSASTCVGPRRGKFYHQLVTFEIEGVLHRISKEGLVRWSQFFRDMFEIPQAPGQREGDSDEKPIRLCGCTNVEFESLLEVLFPQELKCPPSLTKEEWIGVLKLSRLWDMPKVAAMAVNDLSLFPLSPAEKVTLGKAHGVPTWLREGYQALVSDITNSKTTLSELQDLGLETAFRVLRIRDEIYPRSAMAIGVTYTASTPNIFCSRCYQRGYTIRPATIPGNCGSCRNTTAEGFYVSMFDGITTTTDTSQATDVKVSEIFKEELEEARRRDEPNAKGQLLVA
ncbi:hypothetical protein DFP72DRAFT_919645 [Ephemerocybe angulata]|uniref:BTB domain-containing protein n=1 Tax=Ephemerocybe angulata TaxID=980116 RepID=A0A8H6HKQ8_9AGAR|nr:hypothetical protein DFP72DRAFT_919645 [Tulosesus angulatus]